MLLGLDRTKVEPLTTLTSSFIVFSKLDDDEDVAVAFVVVLFPLCSLRIRLALAIRMERRFKLFRRASVFTYRQVREI